MLTHDTGNNLNQNGGDEETLMMMKEITMIIKR